MAEYGGGGDRRPPGHPPGLTGIQQQQQQGMAGPPLQQGLAPPQQQQQHLQQQQQQQQQPQQMLQQPFFQGGFNDGNALFPPPPRQALPPQQPPRFAPALQQPNPHPQQAFIGAAPGGLGFEGRNSEFLQSLPPQQEPARHPQHLDSVMGNAGPQGGWGAPGPGMFSFPNHGGGAAGAGASAGQQLPDLGQDFVRGGVGGFNSNNDGLLGTQVPGSGSSTGQLDFRQQQEQQQQPQQQGLSSSQPFLPPPQEQQQQQRLPFADHGQHRMMTMEEIEQQMMSTTLSGLTEPPAKQAVQPQEQQKQTHGGDGGGRGSHARARSPAPANRSATQVAREHEQAEKRAARVARFVWKPVGKMTVAPAKTGPNQYIQVDWTIPESEVSTGAYGRQNNGGNDDTGDWVGLFRARTRVDAADGYILNRNVNGRSKLDSERGQVNGSIRLRTPRGVGSYNFRYFRAHEESEAGYHLPLARSNTVSVEVQGGDMFEALDFVQRNLGDRKKLSNATLQFATLLRQLTSLRTPLKPEGGSGGGKGGGGKGGGGGRNKNQKRGGGRSGGGGGGDKKQQQAALQEQALVAEVMRTVRQCVSQVKRRCDDLTMAYEHEKPQLEQAREIFAALNERKEKTKQDGMERLKAFLPEGTEPSPEEIEQVGLMEDEDFAQWKDAKEQMVSKDRSIGQNLRDRASLFSALHAVLEAFLTCKCVCALLGKADVATVRDLLGLYCPVEELFFETYDELAEFYEREFSMSLEVVDKSVGTLTLPKQARRGAIWEAAQDKLEDLMPPDSMEEQRRGFVDELQGIINHATARWGCDGRLVPFGSSVNSFGTENSDLDICLVLIPKNASWPDALHEDSPSESEGAPTPVQAVEDLAQVLVENDFEDVDDSRKTARIPILQFRHGALELECDICIDNRLAIRNTLLLKTYAEIDPRVRQLGYLIKIWSKNRRINNPAERTLSSYGYVLLLLHFLQQLNPPVLPPLQGLAPGWDGKSLATVSAEDNEDLPVVLVSKADGRQCNTYFYADPQSPHFRSPQALEQARERLRKFSARNTEAVPDLLIKFFWTMGLSFDWRRYVVSVRNKAMVLKETKASEDSWKLHQRMAIEDPFETGYDVAHVVRDKEFRLVRREFVRAYAVLVGASSVEKASDSDAFGVAFAERSS